MGVEKARGQVFGDYTTSFEKLRWYVDQLKKTDPGTYTQFEYDSTTLKFSRLFIAFRACIQGFNDCRPLLFLDGTFLKGRTKGCVLAATAKDGNQGMYPILTVEHVSLCILSMVEVTLHNIEVVTNIIIYIH